jgi:hypothetical protein
VVPVVQALPSSHGIPTLIVCAGHPVGCTHAPTEWQLSLGVQVTPAPPPHVPLVWQVSPVVQASPSLHDPVVETVKSKKAAWSPPSQVPLRLTALIQIRKVLNEHALGEV